MKAFSEAKTYIPGGVNSPVRAFKSVDMNPVYFERGQGSRVHDIDGNEYIDYVASWGPLIAGHSHPQVVQALKQTLEKGTSFGAPTEIETELAKRVIERVPSVDLVRMVNSGTEATMSAIRVARGFTGRDKIIKFSGGYHGHADHLLIKAGSGVATLGLPDSPGVPKDIAAQTITVPYNDLASVELVFEQHGADVAAIIVEPVAGNMGVVPPELGFLEGLREITEGNGSLLIFDEVMTGFRVNYACAQGLYDIEPDLTCFGKVIGGGLPVGAYGGKQEIMEQVAPLGPVYQAGTLSGNPLAMTAGYETLGLMTKDQYVKLEEKGSYLEEGFRQNAQKHGIAYTINRVGSMLSLFFTAGPVLNFDQGSTCDVHRFTRYFQLMMKEGIYLAPSQFEGMFISTAHTQEDLDRTIAANEKALSIIANEG